MPAQQVLVHLPERPPPGRPTDATVLGEFALRPLPMWSALGDDEHTGDPVFKKQPATPVYKDLGLACSLFREQGELIAYGQYLPHRVVLVSVWLRRRLVRVFQVYGCAVGWLFSWLLHGSFRELLRPVYDQARQGLEDIQVVARVLTA